MFFFSILLFFAVFFSFCGSGQAFFFFADDRSRSGALRRGLTLAFSCDLVEASRPTATDRRDLRLGLLFFFIFLFL